MIEQLFGSKTRVKLLKLFYSNPNRAFYVREITRKIDEQINSVRRELANLLSLGLIKSDNSSNHRLYYEVDQTYEHYEALRSMFAEGIDEDQAEQVEDTEEKTTKEPKKSKKPTKQTKNKSEPQKPDDVVELPEAVHWAKSGNIVGIAYSGVYTRDETSGVDIVVVGDVVASKVDAVVAEMEKEKNKELRYAVMDQDEWKYRKQVRDKFWLQFMGAKKQVVLDKDNIFAG